MKLNLGSSDSSHKVKKSAKGSKRILRSSRLLTFIFFLGVAFVFWILQRLQGDFVRSISIPIVYDSIALNNALGGNVPETLDLQVQDKGFEHIRYSLDGMEPIILKTSREAAGREYIGISKQELKTQIEQRLSSSAQVLQQSVSDIHVLLHKRVSKRVPIMLGSDPSTAAGFTASAVELHPADVVIFGTKESLDSINQIGTQALAQRELRQSISSNVDLILPAGVYCQTRQVRVHVTIEELTEQSFTLPVQTRGVPTGYVLHPLPSSVTVLLTIPRSRYADLVEADVELSINYAEALADRNDTDTIAPRQLPVELSKYPDWVKRYSLKPEAIQFVLERVAP
ncbi:MAG: hypothetical protein Q4A64_06070 [Porphyromonadaceae bacterium]|nr:hypothetical protein [Porphyromonadaceae bacterium]